MTWYQKLLDWIGNLAGQDQGKLGTKEIEEVIVALNSICVVLLPAMKKAKTALDLIKSLEVIQQDPSCRAQLEAALADIGEVPAEIQDLHKGEILKIALLQVRLTPSLIQAIAKEVPANG